MPSIEIIRRDGEASQVTADEGKSVMEALRDGGMTDLLALCGGSCACATCHVYVADDWFDRLEPPNDTEDGLLDSSDFRKANSRLACQIKLSDAIDGLVIEIAPED